LASANARERCREFLKLEPKPANLDRASPHRVPVFVYLAPNRRFTISEEIPSILR